MFLKYAVEFATVLMIGVAWHTVWLNHTAHRDSTNGEARLLQVLACVIGAVLGGVAASMFSLSMGWAIVTGVVAGILTLPATLIFAACTSQNGVK